MMNDSETKLTGFGEKLTSEKIKAYLEKEAQKPREDFFKLKLHEDLKPGFSGKNILLESGKAKLLPTSFVMGIIGKMGSGKTSLIVELLKNPKAWGGEFVAVLCISPSAINGIPEDPDFFHPKYDKNWLFGRLMRISYEMSRREEQFKQPVPKNIAPKNSIGLLNSNQGFSGLRFYPDLVRNKTPINPETLYFNNGAETDETEFNNSIKGKTIDGLSQFSATLSSKGNNAEDLSMIPQHGSENEFITQEKHKEEEEEEEGKDGENKDLKGDSPNIVLVILDDCIADIKAGMDSDFSKLIWNRRHQFPNLTVSFLITTQKYKAIPTDIRQVLDGLIQFSIPMTTIDEIQKECVYLGSNKEWRNIVFRHYQQHPRNFIYLDIYGNKAYANFERRLM